MTPDIKRYLDDHGATYTPEALRKGLVDAGHDPAGVDEALREWAAAGGAARPEAGARRTFNRWAVGLHVAALVATFVLLVVLKGTGAMGTALLGVAVLSVALLIGWAITALIGRALLGAGVLVALIAPAISALLLAGTCFALLSSAIGTPPRQGTVELTLLAPHQFQGSGSASCYVGGGVPGVSVNASRLGTLNGRSVSLSLSWHDTGTSGPAPVEAAEIYVTLEGTSPPDPIENFGVIFSTDMQVDADQYGLAGTIDFMGLVSDTARGSGGSSAAEELSGSVTWNCE